MNRRRFMQTSASLAALAFTPHGHAHSHHQVNEAPFEATGSAAPPKEPLISGQGEFRYQYVPEKLALPDEVVPHGLNIDVDKDGNAVLYHANNDATVHKTTLDGRILWTQKWSPQMGNYKPTDAVAPPGTDRVLIADGYGSSMIHALKASDGIYAGKSWGGLGSAHGELNCPHGITFDTRRKLLLTADRGNKRLEYFTAAGFYHSTIQAKEITAPCNADVWGEHLLVPDLDGPCVILNKDNQVISVVEVGKLLGEHGFRHPHDAIWLANGDIAVCTWNPGRLGYWKRLT
jgi:hypothetical protein